MGVSTATVSMVLNDNRTRRVGAAKRELILKTAQQLNYKPNLYARALVGGESSTLGLIIATLRNPGYADATQSIIERAKERGYGVITGSITGQGLETEQRYVQDLNDRGVDGIIICSALRDDPFIFELRDRGVPFVLAIRDVDQEPQEQPVDFIGVDDLRGSKMAMEHLIDLGHQRIALLTGPSETSTGLYRYRGAVSAMENRGLALDERLLFRGDYSREAGYEEGKRILTLEPRPTAVFSANDIMAIGVLDAMAEKGLRAPEDMALVGYDDIQMAGLPGVNLTTVSHQMKTLGKLAVDRLLDRVTNESGHVPKKILIDPILVVRKTCGVELNR